MTRKGGTRFRLLIYSRMWQRWAWLCILITAASFVIWWAAPRTTLIRPSLRPLTLIPALASMLILAYAHLARRMAWVQCRSNQLYIRTPLHPLSVSYSRLKAVRPTTFAQVFDPDRERGTRRAWSYPYWNRTVIVVEISGYPIPKTWLRLWFSRYLLTPGSSGFVFLVDDWMALSRQLDDFRTNWEMRRAAQRQEIQARRWP